MLRTRRTARLNSQQTICIPAIIKSQYAAQFSRVHDAEKYIDRFPSGGSLADELYIIETVAVKKLAM